LHKNEEDVERDFTVGPILIDDDLGKEVITIFTTSQSQISNQIMVNEVNLYIDTSMSKMKKWEDELKLGILLEGYMGYIVKLNHEELCPSILMGVFMTNRLHYSKLLHNSDVCFSCVRTVQRIYVEAFYRHIWDPCIDMKVLDHLRERNMRKGGLLCPFPDDHFWRRTQYHI